MLAGYDNGDVKLFDLRMNQARILLMQVASANHRKTLPLGHFELQMGLMCCTCTALAAVTCSMHRFCAC